MAKKKYDREAGRTSLIFVCISFAFVVVFFFQWEALLFHGLTESLRE